MKRHVRRTLARIGWGISRLNQDERQYCLYGYDDKQQLPADALDTLFDSNPELKELRQRYASLKLPVCSHTVWARKNLAADLNLPWFRGDNAYVWQFRQLKSEIRLKQYLTYLYVRNRDELGLFDKLEEDGAFGCWTFNFGSETKISRDLVESVNEINFLQRMLSISEIEGLKILDIGAGYGRLAYRMCSALPNVASYHCVDAVPESTFLCDYYLKFRRVDDRAASIPLHELGRLAPAGSYQLAVNIHSFSECTHESVCWWLEQIRKLHIPYLLIVPNDPETFLTTEADGAKVDFFKDVEASGYSLMRKEPIFDDDEMNSLIGVRDQFFLFQRREV